jgi:hypothetical protein
MVSEHSAAFPPGPGPFERPAEAAETNGAGVAGMTNSDYGCRASMVVVRSPVAMS